MAVDANSGSQLPASTSASSLSPPHPPQPQLSTQTQIQFSPGQKRSAPAYEADVQTTYIRSTSSDSNPHPTLTNGEDKENRDDSSETKSVGYTATPALTPASLATIPMHTGPDGHGTPTPTGQPHTQAGFNTPPVSKKRKLSPAEREAKQQEKEVKQQEKEAKEKQRLEEKAKKEEEKAKKEEEKKKRDAEKEEERKKREEKKKAKDEEKAAKDEEKRKKEEEKLKKERAQTKLNSFFAKPKSTVAQSQPPSKPISISPKKPSEDRMIVDTPTEASGVSDYKRAFPDFFLQRHTYLAPPHRFERDAQAVSHLQDKVDSYLKSAGSAEPLVFRPSELFKLIPYKRRRGALKMSVRDILLQMQSLHDAPETSEATNKLQNSLRQVRMKSLKFGEDVRPPYMGTYTKQLPQSAAARLMRNPFRRELPEVNYDYDSEAEWEDAEEGEELDSEEEEEGSEEGDDDMDGFLDDEDDQLLNGKRRMLVGDLEPVSTGLKWQEQEPDPELQAYKIETILPSVGFPIDPFSSAYWQKAEPAQPNRSTLRFIMGHPGSHTLGPQENPSGKTRRALPVELLAEFKSVVEGSNLTKTGLVEVLKKRFPKISKDTLKGTLDSVATRVGQKEVDKKWVCK
ncbi:chromatin assembly factor 1 subunit A-domain-containing protein [Aspergillus pseudodeflectus]|uniref:Chromatin assembly factor 1 subunit A-domain-containing protein n=1 Tax=Aspergillus pseudodeflectus TaxID=176178 RepID=A0ABR4JD72_9EURO